ncbi:hypothetical protein V6N11_033003 [Hibiscus sabdariffa]|uniref:Uncharacterized protein n=1 Tax=Hibiscus sabdariffa TaxID=183260 RepID=A0ABR1ZZ58_9ROSI
MNEVKEKVSEEYRMICENGVIRDSSFILCLALAFNSALLSATETHQTCYQMQKRKEEGMEKQACLILSFETGPKTEHEMVWPWNHMVAVVQPPTDAVVEGSLLVYPARS